MSLSLLFCTVSSSLSITSVFFFALLDIDYPFSLKVLLTSLDTKESGEEGDEIGKKNLDERYRVDPFFPETFVVRKHMTVPN